MSEPLPTGVVFMGMPVFTWDEAPYPGAWILPVAFLPLGTIRAMYPNKSAVIESLPVEAPDAPHV